MEKSDFELYHEDEILSIPTNRINTVPNNPTDQLYRVFNKFIYDDIQDTKELKKIIAIDNMVGGQLDDYGIEVDMPRLGKSDEIYRFLLKLHSINRTSQGTFNELIRIISTTFSIDPKEFQVKNDYVINDDGTASGKPYSVSVKNIPLDQIQHPEIIETFIRELSNALVFGVTLSDLEFAKYAYKSQAIATSVQTFRYDVAYMKGDTN